MNLSSGTQSLIAGAIIDFVGYLTTRPKTIKAGANDLVYDIHDALVRWATERKLDLDHADPIKWNVTKTASEATLHDLFDNGQENPRRIAGAVVSFVEFVHTAGTTDYENAFVKWASKTGLEIHDPQERWAAHWWA
jgi:hypothetical protein